MDSDPEELFAVLSRGEPWELQRQYFPSKVGGFPAWLNPVGLPSEDDLRCPKCFGIMTFVLQIYAPTENDVGFHRTIFVFACQPCMYEFKAFRSQLGRRNDFYDYEPVDEGLYFEQVDNEIAEKCCSVCMLPTSIKSTLHERCQIAQKHKTLDATIPEYQLLICEGKIDRGHGYLSHEQKLYDLYENKTDELKDVCESEQDAIEQLQESRGIIDNSFQHFCSKTTPNEVIYYCRNGKPLYLSDSSERPDYHIPNCEQCGGIRTFEFQILPQILHHLEVPRIEFGTVTIYTCANSCKIEGYAREYVFVEADVSMVKRLSLPDL
ncbi:Programmed cell death protein 2 [Babesia duncani]|uniref:Programmed cell death protein 2 n=1 Tax=Babesia duncani TaxID=323732 RepID=A0AAD9PNI1_9APIC|nr:Programmed cell death protein 2 [Babesia duncani]